MAILCDYYPEIQVSKENVVDIQRVIGGLVDELLEKGFSPRLIDTKEATNISCQDEETRNWLAS
jgi:hypothetical protein